MEIEDAGGPSAPDGRRHLRATDRHDDDDLQDQEHRKSPAVRKRAELKPSPRDAQAKRLDDHDRAQKRLQPQSRSQVLDEDRIVEPGLNSLPDHHESSFDPTLRNRSSRLSRRRSNEATRTPPCTRALSNSLAAS